MCDERICSDWETADFVLGGRNVGRLELPELNELAVGDFEGMPVGEFDAWMATHGGFAAVPPGGESWEQALVRWRRAYEVIAARPEERVLVIAHQTPLAVLFRALDTDYETGGMIRHAIPYPVRREELMKAIPLLRLRALHMFTATRAIPRSVAETDAHLYSETVRTGVEVAVFVSRNSDAEVLLVHRSAKQGNYWHVVAGGVEPGESVAKAAERELREETGLVAEVAAGVDVVEYVDPRTKQPADPATPHDPGVIEIAVTCFLVNAPLDWEPELNWEHDRHRWCHPAEALDSLRWPGTAQAFRDLCVRPSRAVHGAGRRTPPRRQPTRAVDA